MTDKLFDIEKLHDACHVANWQLKCDACNHRLRTRGKVDCYIPMYPFCPWCGAPVTVDAQMLVAARRSDHGDD